MNFRVSYLYRVIPFCLILFFLAATPALGRIWTERGGRSYEGEFSGVVNGFVEIDANGRIIRVRLEDLSDADQQYVREQQAPPVNNAGGNNNSAPPVIDNSGGGNANAGGNGGGAGNGQGSGEPAGAGSTVPNLGSRTWTDNTNRNVEGRFGGLLDQTTVRIIQGNGAPIDVPIANLSQSDQTYVSEVVRLFDPRVHGRVWAQSDNTTFQGTFIQIKNTQIWILTSFDDDRLEIEALDLSTGDLTFVCTTLDQRVARPPALEGETFRIWTAGDGSWAAIGRLKDVSGTSVVLEQEDDDILIVITDLTSDDQAYIRERFPDDDGLDDEENSEQDSTATEFDKQGFDWARYYYLHPAFYVIFVVSVLGLICAIAFKYISESFQNEDD